jgi:hypothetical protein
MNEKSTKVIDLPLPGDLLVNNRERFFVAVATLPRPEGGEYLLVISSTGVHVSAARHDWFLWSKTGNTLMLRLRETTTGHMIP